MPNEAYDSIKPKVSIILPTFSRGKNGLFAAAVRSVINQEYKNWELIIVDDASVDGTEDLIALFMNDDKRINCIRHTYNIGVPAISEYEGIVKARGEYIAFIFDDNEWKKDYLYRTMEYIVLQHAKATYGLAHCYFGMGERDYIVLGDGEKFDTNYLLAKNYISTGSVVMHRSLFHDPKIGVYDPHVSLTRLCDWNLWKRLAQYYNFEATGILAGKEKRGTRSESLAKSCKGDNWISGERENNAVKIDLSIENYENLDIAFYDDENSEAYVRKVNELYGSFMSKKWWKPIAGKARKKSVFPKRLLVITRSLDASIALSFGTFSKMQNKYNVRIIYGDAFPEDILSADAVILFRDLIYLEKYLYFCKAVNVPCFYYADDNFKMLKGSESGDVFLKQMEEKWSDKALLGAFDSVIASSINLAEYIKKECHVEHAFTWNPIFDETRIYAHLPKEIITISFMGGAFREQIFINYVLPAIKRLEAEYEIELILPNSIREHLEIKMDKVHFVPRSPCLEKIVRKYAAYEPDIQIHCGPKIDNNVYKTRNALLNAVQTGAILITSNVAPFTKEQDVPECWLCAEENSVSAWENVIREAISNYDRRKTIMEAAREYCIKNYGIAVVTEQADIIFKDVMQTSDYEMLKRYETLLKYNNMYDVVNNFEKKGQNAPMQTVVIPTNSNRPLNEAILGYNGGIKECKKYAFVSTKDMFSRLGICFATLGNAKGQVVLSIKEKGNVIRKATLNMNEFVRDNWTFFVFDPIENAKGKKYTIELKMLYEEGSDLLGVFEDSSKQTLWYNAISKFGWTVKDRLYIDYK